MNSKEIETVRKLRRTFVFCGTTVVAERRWNSMRESQLYCRRGSVQLWQFLLALLEDGLNGTIIIWTGKGLEFKLVEPEEVRNV